MEKYINVKTGEEIKIGDYFHYYKKEPWLFGYYKEQSGIIKITEWFIEKLIKEGMITKVEVDQPESIWDKTIQSLVVKTKWNVDKLSRILEHLDSVDPNITTQIMLKEIAIQLDKKYKDHIENSEKIYTISPYNGKICEVPKNKIKSYKAFPAFRSIEDAKIACFYLKRNFRALFRDEKK